MTRSVSFKQERKAHRLAVMHAEVPLEDMPPSLAELKDKRPRGPARGGMTEPRAVAAPPPGTVDSTPLRDGHVMHKLDRLRSVTCSRCDATTERLNVIAARMSGKIVCSHCFKDVGRPPT